MPISRHAWSRRVCLAVLVAGVALVATAAPAAAQSAHRRSSTSSGASSTGRYVVVLHDDSDPDAVAADQAGRYRARVSYVYHRALHGYAATMSPADARALAGDPQVESVEPDRRVRFRAAAHPAVPWDLDRIDQASPKLDGSYTPAGDGDGVTAYVIDTGIRLTHHQFEGRAVSGFDAVDGGDATDCNGHGTHVAGTIGGATSGVAKKVRLVAVRVLGCDGSGTTAGVIAGIDWVTKDHKPGTPAVANMSLGGGVSAALDRAVKRSIADGVTYAVAAGNDGADACGSSPARVPDALTVGASDRKDHKPSWSNLGACVDVYAPGARITSAWDSSDTASKVLDGTSMASPHVAGAAALYLQHHPSATPAEVASALTDASAKSVIDLGKAPKGNLLQVT
jgi:subtilisin family serine protease